MESYFLDTSAIVKYYFLEQGHNWVVALCEPERRNCLYIAQAALVETVATICRKAREQSILDEERDALIEKFRQDSQNIYAILPVTTAIYTSAGNSCRSHRLCAYDAVQLACALALRDESVTSKEPSPIFVCADNNLLAIATAEGLTTDNPNSYTF